MGAKHHLFFTFIKTKSDYEIQTHPSEIIEKTYLCVDKIQIMNTKAEIKTTFHHLIDGIEDTSMLKRAYAVVAKLLAKKDVDFWDELSDKQKAEIDESIAQLDRGEGIPHDQVMKEIKLKYKI